MVTPEQWLAIRHQNPSVFYENYVQISQKIKQKLLTSAGLCDL